MRKSIFGLGIILAVGLVFLAVCHREVRETELAMDRIMLSFRKSVPFEFRAEEAPFVAKTSLAAPEKLPVQ